MRFSLVLLIIIGCGFVYFLRSDGAIFNDGAFRMAALEEPQQAGQLTETIRSDLFVPFNGPFEYSVPSATTNAAQVHALNGRQWYSYQPVTGDTPFSVVMLFHGAGRDGLSMIDMWRRVADQEGLFLIAVDGRNQNWPAEAVEPSILHDILNAAQDIAPINPDRVYLFGHSNGAKYVQMLINQAVGPWRAAAVHAGFADPALAIIPADPKPIRYYMGTNDHIFRPDVARFVANAMAQKGHPVDLQFIPEHTHWFYAAGPMISADAWDWLSQQ